MPNGTGSRCINDITESQSQANKATLVGASQLEIIDNDAELIDDVQFEWQRQVTASKEPRTRAQSLILHYHRLKSSLWPRFHICFTVLCISVIAAWIVWRRLPCPQQVQQFYVDGRAVLVNVPGDCDRQCTAAVIYLHGSGDTADSIVGSSFECKMMSNKFYMVYPSMSVPRSAVWGYDRDLHFFGELDSVLRRRLKIQDVFISGHSAGGTMSLYLQNELPTFSKAGIISAGVGHLHLWNMSRRGRDTMIIWNRGDLKAWGGLKYLDLTVATLRKCSPSADALLSAPIHLFFSSAACCKNVQNAKQPWQTLPTCKAVEDFVRQQRTLANSVRTGASTELLIYSGQPQLHVLEWGDIEHGTHAIPNFLHVDAARELVAFFKGGSNSSGT